MSSVYRAIMRQALKIMWQTKFLWFFGFFAAALETDRVVNLVVDKYPRLFEMNNFLSALRESYQSGGFGAILPDFKGFFLNFSLGNILLLVLFLVLGIFLLWLVTVSQGALFSGAYKIYKKQKVSFGSLLKLGHGNFWKTLWLNILARLSVGVIWFIIGLPFAWIFIKKGADWSQSGFVIVSFIVSIIFALLVYFLFRYALLYALNLGLGAGAAIKEAWKLFKKNWLVSIEMAIVLFLADFLTVIILVLGMAVIAVPLMFLYAFLGGAGFVGPAAAVVIILYVLGIAWIIWVAAMSSVFRHVTWTILFVRISEGEVFSKIVRLVAGKTLPPGA